MKTKLSLAVAAVLCATSVSAMQFQTLGYKSVAMGGAGVASSSGSVATYNNPALLAKSTYDVEISLGAGASLYDHGAGASVQALDESGFMNTIDKASTDLTTLVPADVQNLINGKNIIMNMNGNAVEVAPHGYFAVQASGFGIGIFGSSDVVATAVVDQTHNQLIFTDDGGVTYTKIADDGTPSVSNVTDYQNLSVEYAMSNGLTYLEARGVGIAEVPIAYGKSYELSGGNLMIGGALKYMSGTTYIEQLRMDESDTASDTKQEKTTTTFGVDIGLAYAPSSNKDLTVALIGKNLNSPKFDFVDGTSVTIEPMVRAGLAYNLAESLEIAVDVDVTENKTFVYGVESQMLGGGFSYHPASWFALRGGVMENISSTDEAGMIYTAGIGFGLKWLQLDISGQMSDKSTTVDGETVPRYAKANFALISRW